MSKIRLLLVDDHEIVRAGLRMLFSAEPTVEIIGEAASGEAAVAAVEDLEPDVVLMDVASRPRDVSKPAIPRWPCSL